MNFQPSYARIYICSVCPLSFQPDSFSSPVGSALLPGLSRGTLTRSLPAFSFLISLSASALVDKAQGFADENGINLTAIKATLRGLLLFFKGAARKHLSKASLLSRLTTRACTPKQNARDGECTHASMLFRVASPDHRSESCRQSSACVLLLLRSLNLHVLSAFACDLVRVQARADGSHACACKS